MTEYVYLEHEKCCTGPVSIDSLVLLNQYGQQVWYGEEQGHSYELYRQLYFHFCPALPQPKVRTILHLGKVHMVTARLENLIMISLQNARERVNQMDTV